MRADNMGNTKLSFYEKLVFVAYGYFILLGISWFSGCLLWGGYFNFWASGTVLVFSAQAYFRQKLTNLILGILILAASIYWTLECVYMGAQTGYDLFVKTLLTLSVISLIMSGILIFSYTKLSFKDL